jgi:hypothetical protein
MFAITFCVLMSETVYRRLGEPINSVHWRSVHKLEPRCGIGLMFECISKMLSAFCCQKKFLWLLLSHRFNL